MKTLMIILGALATFAGVAGAAFVFYRRGQQQWGEMPPRPVNRTTPADAAIDQQLGDYYGSFREQAGQQHAHFAQN